MTVDFKWNYKTAYVCDHGRYLIVLNSKYKYQRSICLGRKIPFQHRLFNRLVFQLKFRTGQCRSIEKDTRH